jgi:hypothetical protein
MRMRIRIDGGVLLYLPDFAEGDIVAETGHQARLQVERAQVSRSKTRNQEEDHPADHQRADGHQHRRDAQGAIQLPRKRRARLERRRNRPGGTTANLQRNKR